MQTAYAILSKINTIIINPIILILFGVAFVYFVYGVAQYIWKAQSDPSKIKEGKAHMGWGLFGMFIMVSVFGIFKFLLNTVPTSNNTKQNVDKVLNINN